MPLRRCTNSENHQEQMSTTGKPGVTKDPKDPKDKPKPTLATMHAYTTTLNIARPKKLLVFGVSANQNLNLRDIDISQVKAKDTPYTDASKTSGLASGNIAVPGSIVALPFAGWVCARPSLSFVMATC